MSSIFHTCPACRRTFTRAEWLSLEFVGVSIYDFDDGDDCTEIHEGRNCPCGSTVERLVGRVTPLAPGRAYKLEGRGVDITCPSHPASEEPYLEMGPAAPYLELLDALRATAARCMDLIEENRALRRAVHGPVGVVGPRNAHVCAPPESILEDQKNFPAGCNWTCECGQRFTLASTVGREARRAWLAHPKEDPR